MSKIIRLAGLLLVFILCAINSCKEEYLPPEVQVNNNLLVVDGFLNSGGDSSNIRLSRTRTLANKNLSSPELNATVSVEEEGTGNTFSFQEQGDGLYSTGPLALDLQKKYRVNVNTSSGGVYQSDFVSVKQTPPIDSISWSQESSGVTIYSNTHDPQNNTRYYRYEYEETWEFHSEYEAYLTYENGQVLPILDPAKFTFKCWRFKRSTDIHIASTARLEQDILFENPLIVIPTNDEKISVKYSVLVKQYALTQDAYEYWTQLKKNTEQLGTLFDPQPSQVAGNMHCINNPTEVVLGFISASSVAQTRKFIDNSEVMPWKVPAICEKVVIPGDSANFYFGTLGYSPISTLGLSDYYGAVTPCVDCRLKGGTTDKPIFWP